MIKNAVSIGKNRTGIALSPIDKRAVIEGAQRAVPSMEGDDTAIDETRSEYLEEGATIGSMPPPATVKGAAKAVVDVAQGTSMTVFFDKLGERLAFERTGTRLYSALMSKFDASEPLDGGPSRAELEEMHDDELRHFEILRQAMLGLGADPTAVTPSADVAAVSSLGIIQVLGDPRMNLKQSLEAILVAELVDNDAWMLLIELARSGGHEDLAESFDQALAEEAEHLAKVRGWVMRATLPATAVREAEETGISPT